MIKNNKTKTKIKSENINKIKVFNATLKKNV